MEQEFIFETLLFYNNSPCYYKIYFYNETYIGEPTPHHYYSKTDFPHFIVRNERDSWIVDGVHEQRLVKQILDELEKFLSKNRRKETPA